MKKTALLLLAVCVIIFAAHSFLKEKTVLRIGVECDYAPNNWLEKEATETNVPIANEAGHYAEGYDIQIAKRVAEEINATLEVKRISWSELLVALNRREIDAIFSGMLDTEERRKAADFSDTYDVAQTEYTIVVNTASPFRDAKVLGEFSGAKLVAQKGTLLDDVIAQIPGAVHVPPVNTVREMLSMVVNNEVDGTVINLDTGQTYERKHKNLKVIRFPVGEGFNLGFHGICAGVHKGNTKLLKEINSALAEISKRERKRLMDKVVIYAINSLP